MRIWLAFIVVLFAIAELFDWVKQLSLPLPIYILGGAFLAVASNYDKIVGTYFPTVTSINAQLTPPTPSDSSLPSISVPLNISSSRIKDVSDSVP
ncbi:MAG: hypothetical protein HC908_09215 [Calothrix sp. SM1_7_51]|nr:hypothetical protein [Calothrix sp. SM1_7_51]